MSAMELPMRNGSAGHGGGVRRPGRPGLSLDMTPLVDVAFLLLTFFMFATTMSVPNVMEIAMPESYLLCEPRMSRMLTIYVRKDGKIFYNTGLDPRMVPLKLEEVKRFTMERNAEESMITTLKVDPAAKYGELVNVLDELNLAEGDLVEKYKQRGDRRERWFSIGEMTAEDKAALEAPYAPASFLPADR